MKRIAVAFAMSAVLALAIASQTLAAQMIASQTIADDLPFTIPSLHVKGTVRPVFGNRLQVVTIELNEAPNDVEAARFVLVTADGTFEPIGAGGGADLIVPFEYLPIGMEVGEILASNAIVALTRRSGTSITIEAGQGVRLSFLYELPRDASVRAIRLPDGRELAAIR